MKRPLNQIQIFISSIGFAKEEGFAMELSSLLTCDFNHTEMVTWILPERRADRQLCERN